MLRRKKQSNSNRSSQCSQQHMQSNAIPSFKYLVKKKKYLQKEETLQKIDATLGYSYSRYHLVSKEKHGLIPTFMLVLS